MSKAIKVLKIDILLNQLICSKNRTNLFCLTTSDHFYIKKKHKM